MPSWWLDAARRTQDGVNGGMRAIKQLADLVQGIASFPAIPHQGLLSFGVVNPRSLLHANTPSARWQSLCCIDQLNPQPVAAVAVRPKVGIQVDLALLAATLSG